LLNGCLSKQDKEVDMSLKKILWAMLAGASLSLAGCDDDGGPQELYGPPPDTSIDTGGDTGDADQADALEDSGVDEELATIMYGPQPEYGPPTP
jgi:hypothetical protein